MEEVQEQKAENKQSVKYGVYMEKINTKLKKIMMGNPIPGKSELMELLKITLGVEKDIGEDKEVDDSIKKDLIIRLDTLAWFMTSVIEDVQDLEKASPDGQPNLEEEVDLSYFG